MRRLPRIFLEVLALALLIGLTTPALAGEIKGKVKSVSPDRFEFVLEAKDQTMTFHMDEDAQVMIDNRAATLADLMPGDRVTVIARQEGQNMMAIEVQCQRK